MRKEIELYINRLKIRSFKQIKTEKVLIIPESQLVDLILDAPKQRQPIIKNINTHIAKELLSMYENEDWTPLYICKYAAEQYPQLGIHTPNAVTGELILRRCRGLGVTIN